MLMSKIGMTQILPTNVQFGKKKAEPQEQTDKPDTYIGASNLSEAENLPKEHGFSIAREDGSKTAEISLFTIGHNESKVINDVKQHIKDLQNKGVNEITFSCRKDVDFKMADKLSKDEDFSGITFASIQDALASIYHKEDLDREMEEAENDREELSHYNPFG